MILAFPPLIIAWQRLFDDVQRLSFLIFRSATVASGWKKIWPLGALGSAWGRSGFAIAKNYHLYLLFAIFKRMRIKTFEMKYRFCLVTEHSAISCEF